MLEVGSITSIFMAALALLGAIAGIFKFISNQTENLRLAIAASEKNCQLLVEKAAETESKQRHAANNNIQMIVAKLETGMRTLEKEAASQEQLHALEQRIQVTLTKLEGKLDKLGEVTAEIVAMRQQLNQVNTRLERISDRLDEQGGVNKNTRNV